MLEIFEAAQRAGRFVHEENPACRADVLTDRWPASLEDQERFIGDLRELTQKLMRLIEGAPLEEMRTILGDLFGERPARDVVADYIKRYGSQVKQGSGAHLPGTGQIPAAGMIALSVGEQGRRIRAVFPDFKLTLEASWMGGGWEGPLTPIMRRYRIRVTYFRRRFFDTWTLANDYASVQVVDPVIGLDPRKTGEWPPHIYFNRAAPQYPRLCLYDPRERLWIPEEYIAETIVPWASDWLFFFEGWLATGEWEGGDPFGL